MSILHKLLLLIASISALNGFWIPKKFELIFDIEDKRFYLLKKSNLTLHLFPSRKVIDIFGFDSSSSKNVSLKSFQLENGYMIGDPIANIVYPYRTGDDAINAMLLRINTLYPQPFWRESCRINTINPSIAYWQGRYIVAYRDGGSKVSISWLKENPRKVGNHLCILDTAFEDQYLQMKDINGTIPWNTTEYIREDPRLVVLDNGKILSLSFNRLRAPWDVNQIAYLNISVESKASRIRLRRLQTSSGNSVGSHVKFTPTVWLPMNGRQKNWFTIEYNKEQLFFVNINPALIVRHAGTGLEDDRPKGNQL